MRPQREAFLAATLLLGCGEAYDPPPAPKPIVEADPQAFTVRKLTVNGIDAMAGDGATAVAERSVKIAGDIEFAKGHRPNPPAVVVRIVLEVGERSLVATERVVELQTGGGRFATALDVPKQPRSYRLQVIAPPGRAQQQTNRNRDPLLYASVPLTATPAEASAGGDAVVPPSVAP